jgi:hypothetical protein
MTVQPPELVLAVYPNARGFAFVLFEGPDFIVDWGITEVQADRRADACVKRVEALLAKHEPDILVHREMQYRHSKLAQELRQLALGSGIPVLAVSRKGVRQAVTGMRPPPRGREVDLRYSLALADHRG